MIRILTIQHQPGRRPPYVVAVETNGQTSGIRADARELASFGNFRDLVEARLHITVADQRFTSADGASLWRDEVWAAFGGTVPDAVDAALRKAEAQVNMI